MITSDGGHIMHAGEPADFGAGGNRLLMGGLASFHGRGNAAPQFASEDSATGKGPALYFTFHGCLSSDTDLTEDAGCYPEELDERRYVDEYMRRGLIENEDQAIINFKIFRQDRDRLTDYYNPDSNFYVGRDYYRSKPCGFGM